jgi:hypothetical protein
MRDFEQPGGCEKLERDGFSKPQVFDSLYKVTRGMDTDSRRKLVDKFYDRMSTEKTYRDVKEYKERYGR